MRVTVTHFNSELCGWSRLEMDAGRLESKQHSARSPLDSLTCRAHLSLRLLQDLPPGPSLVMLTRHRNLGRKIKCDGRSTCANCNRRNIPCVYAPVSVFLSLFPPPLHHSPSALFQSVSGKVSGHGSVIDPGHHLPTQSFLSAMLDIRHRRFQNTAFTPDRSTALHLVSTISPET